MAKKKNETTSKQLNKATDSLVDQFVKATKAIAVQIPQDADAFEIAQHASAMIRMANTPQVTATISGYSQVIDVLIKEHETKVTTLLNNK